MEFVVNEKTLTSICNDNNAEIIEYLNNVIDEELQKDSPNCDLIDEIVNTIYELENSDDYTPLLHLALTSESIKKIANSNRSSWKSLNLALRIAIVAAIITSGTFAVNAAVGAITGVNLIEKFTNIVEEYFDDNDDKNDCALNNVAKVSPITTPVTQESTSEIITENSSKTERNDDTTSIYKEKTKNVQFIGIRAEFENFKTAYIYGEELSYDGLTIYAEYSDNSTQIVPLSECAYSKNLDMNTTTDYTLSVTYKGCTVKANITVRPDEATRFSDVCISGDYDYLKTKNGAYITAYKGISQDIVLDTIDNINVYAITTNVFANSDIKTFSSDSVKIIYPSAFENCDSLFQCTIPNVLSIEDKAFKGCTNLNDISLNNDLTTLGKSVFESSGITNLTIPSEITTIPDMLCNNCSKLQEVQFKGNVTTIGKMAFNGCYELKIVKGAGNIENVLYSAFSEDDKMTFDEIPSLKNIGASAFAKCESIEFGKIGDSFVSLGENAFDGCKGITEIVINKNIEVVPANCFNGVDLTKLTLEEGVKRINMCAFRGLDVTKLTIPASVEYIGDYALYSTTLKTITINSKDVEIAERAFYKNRRTTLNVYENSTAHKFAVDNELRFNLIEEV